MKIGSGSLRSSHLMDSLAQMYTLWRRVATRLATTTRVAAFWLLLSIKARNEIKDKAFQELHPLNPVFGLSACPSVCREHCQQKNPLFEAFPNIFWIVPLDWKKITQWSPSLVADCSHLKQERNFSRTSLWQSSDLNQQPTQPDSNYGPQKRYRPIHQVAPKILFFIIQVIHDLKS